jgi:hypothetical protein
MRNKTVVAKTVDQFNKLVSGLGNLDTLMSDFVAKNGPNIDYCLSQKKPMYGIAWTQSGKTLFKLHLAEYVLDQGLVDNVVIATTNLTGAKDQLIKRTREFFLLGGKEVKTTDDHHPVMKPGNVFINMTSASRTSKMASIIEDAESNARLLAKKRNTTPVYPRILVIFDEGEEFHAGVGDSSLDLKSAACDRELYNLIHTRNTTNTSKISIAKVSATLFSHLLIHGQFTGHHGHLDSQQIFQLPISPTYKGIPGGLTFASNLIEEDKSVFTNDAYRASANLSTAKNFKIAVNEIQNLIVNDPHGLVQIGNVVMGVSKRSQEISAKLISRAFLNKGYTTTVWEDEDIFNLNTRTEIIVLVQNGDTDSNGSIQHRLQLIATNWKIQPLAILIVSKKMTSKSITIDLDECHNPKHQNFGYYANFTVWYGPVNGNVTMEIQGMRCTGIRPNLKKHAMITTKRTEEAIQSYYQTEDAFIHKLRTEGTLDYSTSIDWFMAPHKKVAKGNVNPLIGAPNSQRRYNGKKITLVDKQKLITSGTPVLDGHYEIPKSIYQKILKLPKNSLEQRKAVFDFAVSKGFVPQTDYTNTRLRQAKEYYPSRDSAIQAYTRGDDLAGRDALVLMHLIEWRNTGKYSVYCFNSMRNRPQTYVIDDLTFDRPEKGENSMNPEFLSAKIMQSGNHAVFRVK